MKIRDILQKKGTDVITIEAHATIHDAIKKLNEHGIGALVVKGWPVDEEPIDPNISHEHLRFSWGGTHSTSIESKDICGVITERDILRYCGTQWGHLGNSSSADQADYPPLVTDAMTQDLIIGLIDDDVNYAMSVMSKKHVRHLPILDEGELAGIISMDDVVNAHVDEVDYEVRMLKDYVQGRTY